MSLIISPSEGNKSSILYSLLFMMTLLLPIIFSFQFGKILSKSITLLRFFSTIEGTKVWSMLLSEDT